MKVESDLLVRLSKVQKEFWEKRDKFRSHFGDDGMTECDNGLAWLSEINFEFLFLNSHN